MKTLKSQVQDTHYKELLLARLSTGFAVLATLLAVVGVYGVTSFTVGRRTQEIGIRVAFGATRARILLAVLGDVLLLTIFGIAIGVFASLAVAEPLQSQLYGIQPIEPGIIVAATVTIVIVSILAGTLPALRAMRTDPLLALRHE
jgi:ABC-type antimicrobial peptide transport system permease subunit